MTVIQAVVKSRLHHSAASHSGKQHKHLHLNWTGRLTVQLDILFAYSFCSLCLGWRRRNPVVTADGLFVLFAFLFYSSPYSTFSLKFSLASLLWKQDVMDLKLQHYIQNGLNSQSITFSVILTKITKLQPFLVFQPDTL